MFQPFMPLSLIILTITILATPAMGIPECRRDLHPLTNVDFSGLVCYLPLSDTGLLRLLGSRRDSRHGGRHSVRIRRLKLGVWHCARVSHDVRNEVYYR